MNIRSHALKIGIVFSGILAGCGGSNNTFPPYPAPDSLGYAGVWQAPAYGKVYYVSEENNAYHVKVYDVTSVSCLLTDETNDLSPEDIQSLATLSEDKNQFEEHEEGIKTLPGKVFERIDVFPKVCVENKYAVKGKKGYKFNAERDFEIFWHTMNELYLDFDLRGVDWDSTYENTKLGLWKINTELELFRLFAAMISPLGDAHNVIFLGRFDENSNSQRLSTSRIKPTIQTKLLIEYLDENGLDNPMSKEQSYEAAQYIEDNVDGIVDAALSFAEDPDAIETRADGAIMWFKTADNLGYIFLSSMGQYYGEDSDIESDVALANAAIDEALEDLQDVEGMIIDVRLNDGGNDWVSMAYVSRFLDTERHLYSKQARLGAGRTPLVDVYIEPHDGLRYLGPTVVLTSSTTVSAGELFTMTMDELANVTLVGEATAGALSDMLLSRVTADIAFSFSNEYYLTPRGEWYERDGIPVDIEVPFATRAQRQAGRDEGMEQAIELLTQ